MIFFFCQLLPEINLLSLSFTSVGLSLCPVTYSSNSLPFSQVSDSEVLNSLDFSLGPLLPLVFLFRGEFICIYISSCDYIFEFKVGIYNFTIVQMELIFKQ